MKITGIMPPMITPFKDNGDVDYDAFVGNIERWNDDRLSGYLVLGSNSEAAYLTESEKLELIRLAVRTAEKGRLVMAGTGMESERATIELTNKAASLGAEAALVLTPFYYGPNMTSEALVKYYTRVAEASEIPILIYNVPKYTHISIHADALALLSRHPKIVGMKDSSGDMCNMALWKRVVPEDFNLIVGTASALFPALALGVEAGILALANCNPNQCAAVREAFEAGDWVSARAIHQYIFPVNTVVTTTYGIAGLKYACDRLGYAGGHVRAPLLGLNDEAKASIDAVLTEAQREIEPLRVSSPPEGGPALGNSWAPCLDGLQHRSTALKTNM